MKEDNVELTNLSFLHAHSNNHKIIGAVASKGQNQQFNGSLLHDFEVLIIVVCSYHEQVEVIEHRIDGSNTHVQVIYVDQDILEQCMITGDNRIMIEHFLKGELLWDTNEQVDHLRKQFIHFSSPLRERRIFLEFTQFLTQYVEAKHHMKQNQVMDAYNSIFQALQHWARIDLSEKGIYPESAVWEQVRTCKLDVYKLYEQLAFSTETMEQRVELVLLACEFSVMSKMRECSSILFQVLRSRKQPWSVKELLQHPDLSHVGNMLPMVIRKLVFRSLINEVVSWRPEQAGGEREIRYWLNR